ncbi:hypothetical protein [Polyangium aurulentum]|uniref:hypothetical protein n=1 Tax=Polyangium aurulentum TaxID=2567896 RepID=UPI0010AE9D23|nr:hypothetical protein [Polyangium aurulentum]UQA59177.1 hypothetical protein E8A73_001265 [Polyangium aurulentum]
MRITAQRIAAGITLCIFAGTVASACVIRIGPGDDSGSGNDDGTSTDPGTEVPNDTAPTPEEMLASADPQALAIARATADTAGYITMASFAGTVGDPAFVDAAMFEELMATYAPPAFDEAIKWIAGLDPATLEASVFPQYECNDTHGCPFTTSCDFAKTCIVTGCGNTRCGPCPEKFDLTKFAHNGWCSYTCMAGKDITGIAMIFFSKLLNIQSGPYCFPNK